MRSAQVCLIKYENDLWTPQSYLNWCHKHKGSFNETQVSTLAYAQVSSSSRGLSQVQSKLTIFLIPAKMEFATFFVYCGQVVDKYGANAIFSFLFLSLPERFMDFAPDGCVGCFVQMAS
jgi:hypothetical protein